MKVRNFAFFGVMAAILSVSAANADTVKRIASTNYVDNKVDNQHNGQVITATDTTGVIGYKQIDSAVTQGSSNLVTSGAVQTAIASATDATTYTAGDGLNLDNNNNEFTANVGDGLAINATSKAIELSSATQASLALADSAVQDVSGKQDKVTGATADNIATLNASGNTQDSGKAITTTVSASSTDAQIPTAAAVQSAITTATADVSGKQDKTDSTVDAQHTYSILTADNKVGDNLEALASAVNTINTGAVMTSGIDSTKVAQIATNASDISDLESNKQDKVTGATADNIATLNASGNTQDSGKAITTTVSASSTDAQIPTALAVQTAISGAVDTAIDGVTYPTVNISGNNALANIDGTAAANQDTHCSANEPCVLTYEGNGAYKWSSIWGLPTNN